MKRFKILVLMFGLFLTSCQSNTELRRVSVNNKFSVEIPSNFMSLPKLPHVSFQHGNMVHEIFIQIVDNYKYDDTYEEIGSKAFAKYMIEDFEQQIIVEQKSEISETDINGMKAYVIEINGTMNNSKAFVILAFIEGSNDFYSLMAWSSARRQFQNRDTMKDIIFSFREE